MLNNGKNDPERENLERWLLTYADLITLLLAFFIIMYSMSKIDAEKFREVAKALHTVLRGTGPLSLPPDSRFADDDMGDGDIKLGDLGVLKREIERKLEELGQSHNITATLDRRGLIIRVSESAFFDLGSAELRTEAEEVLSLIAGFLLRIPNHVRIEGHTDNLPIRTSKFPSNWELSVNRATACVRYLIVKHGFPPERISALGYGEYRPIASNQTSTGRTKNRRVDIIVLTWEERRKEPLPKKEDISQTVEKNSSPENEIVPDQSRAQFLSD
jgi:chemotaxis protein MotB